MPNLNQHFPLVNAPVKPRQVRVVIDHDFQIPKWLQTLAETIGLFVLLGLAPYAVAAAVVHLVLGIFK